MHGNRQALETEIAAAETKLRSKVSSKNAKKARRKLKQELDALKAELERRWKENYVLESMPGCYVAHLTAEWIIGVEKIEPGMFGDDVGDEEISEISVDPEELMLSVVNTHKACCKSFNITLSGECLPVKLENGTELETGTSWNVELNQELRCVSLILVVGPNQVMDVCYLNSLPEPSSLFSDVKLVESFEMSTTTTTTANTETLIKVGFPLGGEGPYLCSQGIGGHFTHIFPGNFYAYDLECPTGTPVLSVGKGKIIQVKDNESSRGIHSSNLFKWNSILMELVGEEENTTTMSLFVEYVHIETASALVKPGDVVEMGQEICKSGGVGFAPRPHLHIQVTNSADDTAKTLPYLITCHHVLNTRETNYDAHQLVAGEWYQK